MQIFVLLKQVPSGKDIEIDPVTHDLVRMGTPANLDPTGYHALVLAKKLKNDESKVVAVTMGPPPAREILKEARALGADEVYLVSDRAFGGADTLATSYTLAEAIRHIGKADLVLLGTQSPDGDTGQIAPQLAEELGFDLVPYVKEFSLEGDCAHAVTESEGVVRKIEAKLPLVVSVGRATGASEKAPKELPEIEEIVLTQEILQADPERIGKAGSATDVVGVHADTVKMSAKGEILKPTDDVLAELARVLK